MSPTCQVDMPGAELTGRRANPGSKSEYSLCPSLISPPLTRCNCHRHRDYSTCRGIISPNEIKPPSMNTTVITASNLFTVVPLNSIISPARVHIEESVKSGEACQLDVRAAQATPVRKGVPAIKEETE